MSLEGHRRLAAGALRRMRALEGVSYAELSRRVDTLHRGSEETTTEGLALAAEALARSRDASVTELLLVTVAALHEGAVASVEKRDGGDAVVLAACLEAILGNGSVHILSTSSDAAAYMHRRVHPPAEMLGLRTAVLRGDEAWGDRVEKYEAAILCAPFFEPGLDYLRSQIHGSSAPDQLGIALVEDVRRVLVDEAETPLQLDVEQRPVPEVRVHASLTRYRKLTGVCCRAEPTTRRTLRDLYGLSVIDVPGEEAE